MTDMTAFLSAELTEMGLMAASDPTFAARLVDALQRLPPAQSECGSATRTSDSAESNVEFAAELG